MLCLALRARELRANGADDLEARGHVLQMPRDVCTDAPQPATATCAAAILARGILMCGCGVGAQLLLLAGKVIRQAAIQRAGIGGSPRRARQRQLMERGRLQEADLGVIESLAGGTVLRMQPARELQGEPLDHQLERRHLGNTFAQVLLEQVRVVGQVADRVESTAHGAALCPICRRMPSAQLRSAAPMQQAQGFACALACASQCLRAASTTARQSERLGQRWPGAK